MSRTYFGEWSNATDMDLALRGLREQYDHADDANMLAPYPLGENPPARVVYAASPSCLRTRRPLIVMVRGGHFHIQRRSDRWSTARIWSTEELRQFRAVFVDREAERGFRDLQDEALHLEYVSSSWIESRCSECGLYIAGGYRSCTNCAEVGRHQFRRDNPIEAARMARAAEKATQ